MFNYISYFNAYFNVKVIKRNDLTAALFEYQFTKRNHCLFPLSSMIVHAKDFYSLFSGGPGLLTQEPAPVRELESNETNATRQRKRKLTTVYSRQNQVGRSMYEVTPPLTLKRLLWLCCHFLHFTAAFTLAVSVFTRETKPKAQKTIKRICSCGEESIVISCSSNCGKYLFNLLLFHTWNNGFVACYCTNK